jgi:hypothetical protein
VQGRSRGHAYVIGGQEGGMVSSGLRASLVRLVFLCTAGFRLSPNWCALGGGGWLWLVRKKKKGGRLAFSFSFTSSRP